MSGHTIAFGKWFSTFILVCGCMMLFQWLGLIASGNREPNLIVALAFLTLSVVGYQLTAIMDFAIMFIALRHTKGHVIDRPEPESHK